MNQREALNRLEAETHVFFGQAEAQEIAQPFGLTVHTYVVAENPRDPKGVRFNDPDVVAARGVSSWDLAVQICHHLNIKYPSMMGRGFQQRACCQAIRDYIAQKDQDNAT